MTAPNPHAVLTYADAPHPFHTWDESPGTAADPEAITPDQWEAGRIRHASRINPTWFVERPKPRWRNPGQRRECRIIDGAEHYRCTHCGHWLRKEAYTRNLQPASLTGIQSACRKCRLERRKMGAAC